MKARRKQQGIALADLLIGLMVGAIVLAAAAAMADAMSRGKQATEQMTRTANYMAQVHIRLADLVMRAEQIDSRDGGGVTLTYGGGAAAALYTDAESRFVIEQDGVMSFLSDPLQTGASVSAIDAHRVAMTFTLAENGTDKTYRMTATKRGGL